MAEVPGTMTIRDNSLIIRGCRDDEMSTLEWMLASLYRHAASKHVAVFAGQCLLSWSQCGISFGEAICCMHAYEVQSWSSSAAGGSFLSPCCCAHHVWSGRTLVLLLALRTG